MERRKFLKLCLAFALPPFAIEIAGSCGTPNRNPSNLDSQLATAESQATDSGITACATSRAFGATAIASAANAREHSRIYNEAATKESLSDPMESALSARRALLDQTAVTNSERVATIASSDCQK